MKLAGRVAVVTGASRGLGAGLAEAFAARGLRLGLCARHAPGLPDGARGVVAELDVADGPAMHAFAARVADRLGPIDLWVNNAGVLGPIGPLREVDPALLARNLEVNVLGVVHGTRAFLAHRAPEAVLLNVSSGAARRPYAGWAAYCASKAAVDLMTGCVALEEAGSGLRAYAVAPGVVDTGMQEEIRACPPERFPEVGRFHERKRAGHFNSPAFVAERLLRIAFDPAARPDDVLVRLPDEHPPA